MCYNNKMGLTKTKIGDGHILFHVGKELPKQGEDFLMAIGKQNAQGRGVYFADFPDLKYSGGEHYRVDLPITPVFCVPMVGKWQVGGKTKIGKGKAYHTKGRMVAMRNLKYKDVIGEGGVRLRYYYSTDVSFFPEPETRIFDELPKALRNGRISFHDAIKKLEEDHDIHEEAVGKGLTIQKLAEAMREGKIPPIEELSDLRDLSDGVRQELSGLWNDPEGLRRELSENMIRTMG